MTLIYNGIQYEVETEGDMEPINFADEEHESNIQIPNNSQNFKESRWTPKVMHLFLDECIKRKTLILNPSIQKYKIFQAIQKQLKSKGHVFKAISLERKFNTMKKHFKVVKRKRLSWQFYDKMKLLIPDELLQENFKVTQPLAIAEENLSPSPATEVIASEEKSNASLEFANQESLIGHLILENNCSSVLSQFVLDKNIKQTNCDQNVKQKSNEIEKLREKILSLEERRTVATEKILLELRQANKLKEEMLDLNIQLFKTKTQMDEY